MFGTKKKKKVKKTTKTEKADTTEKITREPSESLEEIIDRLEKGGKCQAKGCMEKVPTRMAFLCSSHGRKYSASARGAEKPKPALKKWLKENVL